MIKRERASILSPGYDKFEKIHRLVRQGRDDAHDAAVAEVAFNGKPRRMANSEFGSRFRGPFRFRRDISHEACATLASAALRRSLALYLHTLCLLITIVRILRPKSIFHLLCAIQR